MQSASAPMEVTKILRWKQEHCAIHGSKKGNEGCSCDIGFHLIPFPTAKSDRETRDWWKTLINREDPKKERQTLVSFKVFKGVY